MHKGFCKYRRTFWGSRRKTEMKNCEAEMLHFALSWPLEGVLAPPEGASTKPRRTCRDPT